MPSAAVLGNNFPSFYHDTASEVVSYMKLSSDLGDLKVHTGPPQQEDYKGTS